MDACSNGLTPGAADDASSGCAAIRGAIGGADGAIEGIGAIPSCACPGEFLDGPSIQPLCTNEAVPSTRPDAWSIFLTSTVATCHLLDVPAPSCASRTPVICPTSLPSAVSSSVSCRPNAPTVLGNLKALVVPCVPWRVTLTLAVVPACRTSEVTIVITYRGSEDGMPGACCCNMGAPSGAIDGACCSTGETVAVRAAMTPAEARAAISDDANAAVSASPVTTSLRWDGRARDVRPSPLLLSSHTPA